MLLYQQEYWTIHKVRKRWQRKRYSFTIIFLMIIIIIFNIFVIIALDCNSVCYLINLMSTILIILVVTSIFRLFFILFSLSFILFVILFNYSNILYIWCFSLWSAAIFSWTMILRSLCVYRILNDSDIVSSVNFYVFWNTGASHCHCAFI